MLRTLLGVFLLIITASQSMAQTPDKNSFDLDNYQWQNRLVLIFSQTDSGDLYQQQLTEFEGNKEGFADRDLIVLHLFSNASSFGDDRSISDFDTRKLSDEYDVGTESFTVILIGKDGTEKLRTTSVLETEKLFTVIDAMPMRQREMRNQGGNENQE